MTLKEKDLLSEWVDTEGGPTIAAFKLHISKQLLGYHMTKSDKIPDYIAYRIQRLSKNRVKAKHLNPFLK